MLNDKKLIDELLLNFADEALYCKYRLLYRQYALHLLIHEHLHRGQDKQKLFSPLHDVTE